MELLIGGVSASPDPNGLPGSNVGEQIINGLFFWGLLACLGAMIVGAALWWSGGQGHNAYAASRGKTMVIGAFVGAVICGAAPALINFAQGLGSKVQGKAGTAIASDFAHAIAGLF